MRVEHLKEWLRDVMAEEAREEAAADGNWDSSDIGDDARGGTGGSNGDNWRLFVTLIYKQSGTWEKSLSKCCGL